MNYIDIIKKYETNNLEEKETKNIILDFIKKYGDSVLYRSNKIAHFTSSGFIMNKYLNKTLMIHHNIMDMWAWTGGHVDGEQNFLDVSIREAKEETGLKNIKPMSNNIISLDILPVSRHKKNEVYINSHLHLSVAYLLIADERDNIFIKKDENSGVKWINTNLIRKDNFNDNDEYLYKKIINRAEKFI